MIYDCFMISNELDIVELRFRELYDVVDYFVIVEATTCHKGNPKPLYFAENFSRFQPWAAKIRHVVVADMPLDSPDPWVRENHQRNAIQRGIADAAPHDWIIVSDADEIPRPSAVTALNSCKYSVVGFHMAFSFFRINFLSTNMENDYVWTVAYRKGMSLDPQGARNARHLIQNGSLQQANPGIVGQMRHAGWHLSYMGDEAFVANKIKTFAHQEFNNDDILGSLDIQKFLENGQDLYNRPGYKWEVTPLTDFFPKTVVENRDAFAHLIAPWG